MDINYILNEIVNLDASLRSKRIDELAIYYNVTRQTIWRKLNAAGYVVRKEKCSKGETKVSDTILYQIAAQVNISKRLNGNFTNSVKKAVNDLKAEGVDIPVGYARICTLLAERQIDKLSLAKPAPHQQLISLNPNHVWQFDITNCLQWHLKNKGGLTERDVERLFYKNKVVKEAKKIRQELLRFVIVDHCSGAFFFWYYYTSGERAEDGADFFYRAFANKRPLIKEVLNVDYRGSYQMQGVPSILVSDKGSILKSIVMQNLMNALNVKIELHEAGNPRAKGMVEGLMKIIGYDFESNLKRRRVDNLIELNKIALDWCIERNTAIEFRKDYIRAELWLKIKENELRLCPNEQIFKTLQHKPAAIRKADGNRKISYDGRIYQCPDTDAANQKVIVKVNAYEYPSVDIHYNGKVWLCRPLKADQYGRFVSPDATIFGEYKSIVKTDIQKSKDLLEEIAYQKWGVEYKGHKDKRQAVPPKLTTEYEVKVEQKNIITLPKTGVEIELNNVHEPMTTETHDYHRPAANSNEERLVPILDIIRQYVGEFGKMTTSANMKIKALYPNGVPINITLTDIYNQLNNVTTIDSKKLA